MAKSKKGKTYVVFKGRSPGIYSSWPECEAQVQGFSGANHKSYATKKEAEAAWETWQHAAASVGEKFHGLQTRLSFVKNNVSEDDNQPPLKKVRLDRKDDALAGINTIQSQQAEQPPVLEEPVELTPAQQTAVDVALEGHNVFLTGAAGSGKTVTLKEIVRRLEKRFGSGNAKYRTVQVIAPTGISALPLDGKTTYSFAGWNPDSLQQPLHTLLDSAISKQSIRASFDKLKVLIIEEISMVENQFLERLNLLMQHVLKSDRPFGGKQVILVGDFHQLPPVKPFQFCLTCGNPMTTQGGYICTSKDCASRSNETKFEDGDKWAFKASVWTELNLRYIKLEQIHRQKDTWFQDILNKVRNGVKLNAEEWRALKNKKETPPGLFAIRLMSRLDQVRSFNTAKLASLASEEQSWKAHDTSYKLNWAEEDEIYPRKAEITRKQEEYKQSLKHHRFPTDLTLKIGAKVVLLSNLNPKLGLVNGSQGEVVKFVDTQGWQVPDKKTNPAEWRALSDNKLLENSVRPVVRFANGQIKTILSVAQESLKGTAQDKYIVCRNQIPLTLGWALSIHKSQGMTLEYVELSSNDIFESGQLYVGLSRAKTLDGLTVTGFSQEQTLLDEDVLHFYQNTSWEILKPPDLPEPDAAPNITTIDAATTITPLVVENTEALTAKLSTLPLETGSSD